MVRALTFVGLVGLLVAILAAGVVGHELEREDSTYARWTLFVGMAVGLAVVSVAFVIWAAGGHA